jgi:hypothetical protein
LISSTTDPRCSRLCTCRLSHEERVQASPVCTPRTVCPSRSNALMRMSDVCPGPIWPTKRIFAIQKGCIPGFIRRPSRSERSARYRLCRETPPPACGGGKTRHHQIHTGQDRSHTIPDRDQCAAHVKGSLIPQILQHTNQEHHQSGARLIHLPGSQLQS